jgi:IS1 family transposase
MNMLGTAKRTQILASLVEGNSLRATSRMAAVSINTVTKLLVDLGTACAAFQHETLRDLTCQRIQCDEIWSFCYAKEKNLPKEKQGQFGMGDVWTFTAIDADSKLVVGWLAGRRDAACATEFLKDVAERLANRVQITTDGHKMYLTAVPDAFYGQGQGVDFAQLLKIYGNEPKGESRYSPAICLGIKPKAILGDPDPGHVSTSYVERQNLTMRVGMRRFTRLTNGFSKKIENHAHAIAIHFMFYNFGRIHKTLKTTPAIAAGVTDHVWSLAEIVGLLGSN